MSVTDGIAPPGRAVAGEAGAFDVAVIGGGPAGAVCALRLACHGVRTLLVDKAVFPRAKVCGCCLNLSAVAALRRCGLSELPRRLHAVPLRRWEGWMNGQRVQCALPGGWSLSREALDHELLKQAAAAGAEVRTGTAASIAEVCDDAVRVALRSPNGEAGPVLEAPIAVVATGLAGGGLERWLPWRQPPSGPLGTGVSMHCPDGQWQPGVIYMACGRDGYVGAVVLEDGRLDLAAALRRPGRRQRRSLSAAGADVPLLPSSVSLGQRMRAILQQAGLPGVAGLDSATVAATPRMRRLRQVGNGRLIAIGDAAGYVEPFTGQGMAWAMHSGWAAAECIAAALPGHARSVGDRWTHDHRQLLRLRQLPCRSLAALLQHDLGRRLLFGAMRRAPRLTTTVAGYLNRA